MEILLSLIAGIVLGAGITALAAWYIFRNEKQQHHLLQSNQQQMFQSELNLARESMRGQFEKEMLERTEQLKKANTENMQQVVDPLKRELDLLR
jgi:uncharacterized membrane protein